jgi:hypothetical protein
MRYYDARQEQRDTEWGRTDWNGVARRSQYVLEDEGSWSNERTDGLNPEGTELLDGQNEPAKRSVTVSSRIW